MEERRFDDLTRALGRARSRRQVIKGLLAGVVATVVGKTSGPAPAVAAGGTCSSQTYTKCMSDSKLQYDSLTAHCGTTDGPAWGGSACAMLASLWYSRAIAQCQRAQCPQGMSCVDDHCCRGEHCCQSDQIHCPAPGIGLSGGTCCPAGSTCCEGGCCPPEKTCCLNYTLTFINPSAAEVCTDLQTDPNNCGACRHKCDGLPCIDGTCQCPAGNSICKGPLNQTCCAPNEYCQSSAFGAVECVPRCSPCETYDPTNTAQPCQPVECDACQECDPQSGQCTPSENGTECGSNLLCCSGQCVNEACPGAQTFNLDTCQCECPPVICPTGKTLDPNTCVCGGDCSGVTCDTCNHCNPDTGQCEPVENGTLCGGDSGFGCCNGQCNQYPGTPCCPTSQQDVCGDTCCEPGTGCTLVANTDENAVGNAQTCCPVNDEYPVPGIAKPGPECCPPGEEAFHIRPGYCPNGPSVDEWICCPITAVGLYACCAYA